MISCSTWERRPLDSITSTRIYGGILGNRRRNSDEENCRISLIVCENKVPVWYAGLCSFLQPAVPSTSETKEKHVKKRGVRQEGLIGGQDGKETPVSPRTYLPVVDLQHRRSKSRRNGWRALYCCDEGHDQIATVIEISGLDRTPNWDHTAQPKHRANSFELLRKNAYFYLERIRYSGPHENTPARDVSSRSVSGVATLPTTMFATTWFCNSPPGCVHIHVEAEESIQTNLHMNKRMDWSGLIS